MDLLTRRKSAPGVVDTEGTQLPRMRYVCAAAFCNAHAGSGALDDEGTLKLAIPVRRETRLVLRRRADPVARSRERRFGGRCEGGLRPARQRGFDRRVRHAVGGEQARAHRFDVRARLGARQTREAVQRALSRSPQSREEHLRERGRLRADLRGARQHACRVSRRIEEAIGFGHHEGPFAERFLMASEHRAGAVHDLNRVRIHADGDHARQRRFAGRVVRALDLHEPRIIDGTHALCKRPKALEMVMRRCAFKTFTPSSSLTTVREVA